MLCQHLNYMSIDYLAIDYKILFLISCGHFIAVSNIGFLNNNTYIYVCTQFICFPSLVV